MSLQNKNFKTPLEEGHFFKQLMKKNPKMSAKDISVETGRSIPAIYKYIQMAEMPAVVQKQIKANKIPAFVALKILNSVEPDQRSTMGMEKIEEEIVYRSSLRNEGMKSMTVKRRLDQLQELLSSRRGPKTDRMRVVLKFAHKINEGASVEELFRFAIKR
jgi:hypothetical protein